MKKTYIKPTSKLHNLRQRHFILQSNPPWTENNDEAWFETQQSDGTYNTIGGIFDTGHQGTYGNGDNEEGIW